MISNKSFLLICGFLLLLINIYIVFNALNNKQNEINNKNLIKYSKQLELLHANCNYKYILETKCKELFEKINGLTITEMEIEFQKWCKELNLPCESFKIIAFNVKLNKDKTPQNHTPLNVTNNKEYIGWQHLMNCIDTKHSSSFERTGVSKVRILHVGVPNLLVRHDAELIKANSGPYNTYSIWFGPKKAVNENKINSIFILIHESYLKAHMDSLVKTYFRLKNINSDYYGYFNKNNTSIQYLPDNIPVKKINSHLSNLDLHTGIFNLKDLGIVISSKPNGNVFVAINHNKITSIPIWSLGLIFLWLPIWYKQYIFASGNFKLSVKFLTNIMFILILLLPITIISNYWNKIVESKRKVLKEQKIKYMFHNLINIDVLEAETERLNIKLLNKMVNIINDSKQNSLGINNPKACQQFVDESIKLEIDEIFDHGIILSKKGKEFRKCSLSSTLIRYLGTQPQQFRESVIEQFFNSSWIPMSGELEYLKTNKKREITIDDYLSLRPSQAESWLLTAAKVFCSEIIDLYNLKHKKITNRSVKSSLTSDFLATLMGGKGEEYLIDMYNSLGKYFIAGFGDESVAVYIDVLCNKNGKAEYALFLSSGIYSITKRQLRRLYNNPNKWPKNIDYLALTQMRTLNFPYYDLWNRIKTIPNILKPPLTQYSSEVKINNEPYLLCAYKGNKTENYILIATMPLWIIDHEINKFEVKMILAFTIVLLIIAYILNRIYSSILIPINSLTLGITAMNKKNNDYKVSIHTNDEWEMLANTFNQSLETMKELEIATFLQNTILPSKSISCENISFLGQTISVDGIGGDYFDAFTNDNKMLFLFGDVSGHSVGAALVVSMAHSGFASLFDSGIHEPNEILKSFSNLMLNNLNRIKMMTCFAGYIDNEGNLTCSNAGQTFPLIVDEKGNIIKVSVIGYPLGSAKRAKFKQETIKLPDKCRIVLYSDGIIEAMNNENEPFGYDRFEQLVKKFACNISVEDFKEAIYNELRFFCGSVPWNDDCSIAVVDYSNTNKKSCY